MKSFYKIIIPMVLVTVLFIPFFPVTVVPEWELIFLKKDSTAAASISIDQHWQDYSLEWMSEGNSARGLQVDVNGYIKLPARQIRVSIFQFLSSRIRNLIMSIDPHAGFGADSYIICGGPSSCVVTYKNGNEKPQRVILW